MRHRWSRKWLALLLAVMLIGCGAGSAKDATGDVWEESPAGFVAALQEGYTEEYAVDGDYAVNDDYATEAKAPADLPRMIIYNGNLVLVLADTDAGQNAVVKVAEDAGGYISSASSYSYGSGLRRIDLTLRVPAESFNMAMDALRALALEVTRDSISSQDVTQEYVDLGSRLNALEVKEARLEELMEEAEDTEAVLAVYEELSSTQIQIEEIKGRMRYLERQSGMATITVTLEPDELSRPVEIAGWRPQGTVKRAVEALVNAFQFLVDALIWVVIVLLPVLAFIGLVVYGFVRLLGLVFRRKKRKPAIAEAEAHTEGEGA